MANEPLKVTVKFPDKLPAYMNSETARSIVRDVYGVTMGGAVNIVHEKVIGYTPHAFGHLRASISGEVYNARERIVGKVGTPVQYAQPVEDGSKPHWAPIGPLKLWAKRKLGDERIAYAVQRAIARRGTKGKKMFAKAFSATHSKVSKMFGDANRVIIKRLIGK